MDKLLDENLQTFLQYHAGVLKIIDSIQTNEAILAKAKASSEILVRERRVWERIAELYRKYFDRLSDQNLTYPQRGALCQEMMESELIELKELVKVREEMYKMTNPRMPKS